MLEEKSLRICGHTLGKDVLHLLELQLNIDSMHLIQLLSCFCVLIQLEGKWGYEVSMYVTGAGSDITTFFPLPDLIIIPSLLQEKHRLS